MNQHIDNRNDDLIDLGVASTETKGGNGPKIEDLGFVTMPGIADE